MFDALHPPYGVIAADNPWGYRSNSKAKPGRHAMRHYPVMTTPQIKALPVGDLAAKDCALFLWAISSMLPDALEVMAAWGFRYKTVAFAWAKTTPRTSASWAPVYHFGLGHWTRQNVELVLLGTRGRPKRTGKGVAQLVVTPRREHSRKPDEVYDGIRRLVGGPYLDLFSRAAREGWDVWGNETGKFDRRTVEPACLPEIATRGR